MLNVNSYFWFNHTPAFLQLVSWSLTIFSQFPFPLTSILINGKKKSNLTSRLLLIFHKGSEIFFFVTECRRKNVPAFEKCREVWKIDNQIPVK